MEFLKNSKNYSLNRKTYINLRWIAIIGQFVTINLAAFIFQFEFSFIKSNLVVLIGAISNIYLVSFYDKNLLSNKTAFQFSCNRYITIKFTFLFHWRSFKSIYNIFNNSKCFCFFEFRKKKLILF